jgi:hypothetical protein
METSKAAEAINAITPRPGYGHYATDYSNRFENTVAVRIAQYGAHRSERALWPAYDETTTVWADFTLDATSLATDADIVDALTSVYLQHEEHELREFLRTPDGDAPLHPHTRDGMRAWALRHGSDVVADIAYGYRKIASDALIAPVGASTDEEEG